MQPRRFRAYTHAGHASDSAAHLVRPQRDHPAPAALRGAHRLRVAARRGRRDRAGDDGAAGGRGDDRDRVGRALGDRSRSRARHRAAPAPEPARAGRGAEDPDPVAGAGRVAAVTVTHSTLELNRRFDKRSGVRIDLFSLDHLVPTIRSTAVVL